VPPALPAVPPRRRPRRFLQAAALVVLALGAARPAAAIEIALVPPRESGGFVWVDARLTDLFPPRVAESLARGMPATLEIRAELWRRRTAWFDAHENDFDGSLRIRYEVWKDSFRIERPGAPPMAYGTLDSVSLALEAPFAIPVGRVGALRPGARYYVVASAVLRPLSVEDVDEVEGWLSGEVESQRRSGLGIITQIPRAIFDAARNLAGFGDQRARADTRDFTLEDLFRTDRER